MELKSLNVFVVLVTALVAEGFPSGDATNIAMFLIPGEDRCYTCSTVRLIST